MEPTNPLLSTTLLPLYSEVRLEHLKPAIEHIVADNLQTISRIVATQSRHPTRSGLILPMETLTARLDDAIGVIMTLGQVSRDVPWETTIGDCFRAAHDYKTQVLQDRGLYLACKALAHSPEALSWIVPSRRCCTRSCWTTGWPGVSCPPQTEANWLGSTVKFPGWNGCFSKMPGNPERPGGGWFTMSHCWRACPLHSRHSWRRRPGRPVLRAG